MIGHHPGAATRNQAMARPPRFHHSLPLSSSQSDGSLSSDNVHTLWLRSHAELHPDERPARGGPGYTRTRARGWSRILVCLVLCARGS